MGDWLPQVWVEGPEIQRQPCSGCDICHPTCVRHLRVGYQLNGVWFQDIHGEPYLSTVGAGKVTKVYKDKDLPYWIVRSDQGGVWHLGEYNKVDAHP